MPDVVRLRVAGPIVMPPDSFQMSIPLELRDLRACSHDDIESLPLSFKWTIWSNLRARHWTVKSTIEYHCLW